MKTGKIVSTALLAACAVLGAPLSSLAGSVDVVELTADQIQQGLAAHTFTIEELVQSYLDRINTYEPYYNAFTLINPEPAWAGSILLAGCLLLRRRRAT